MIYHSVATFHSFPMTCGEHACCGCYNQQHYWNLCQIRLFWPSFYCEQVFTTLNAVPSIACHRTMPVPFLACVKEGCPEAQNSVMSYFQAMCLQPPQYGKHRLWECIQARRTWRWAIFIMHEFREVRSGNYDSVNCKQAMFAERIHKRYG